MTQVIVLAKSSEVSTFVQFTWGLPNKGTNTPHTLDLLSPGNMRSCLAGPFIPHMCSWTLEKVLGLTLVNRDSQFPGFHFTPVTRCFTLALCSVLSLFLASVLHSLLRFLPFIPAGCSGSSISSVTGSVFSKALSSLVEHPAPTRSHCYSPGET